VPRGRLPAGNEAIDQNGQHVVGRRRTPPSSPLQFSQPTNPPILLFARLIFQSRSYKFSTPNNPLTKKKVIKTTLCTTVRAQLPPKYPGFREGVLELLCGDIRCPSWKYNNGRIFKITQWFLTQLTDILPTTSQRSSTAFLAKKKTLSYIFRRNVARIKILT
jgi:hypothetical protein